MERPEAVAEQEPVQSAESAESAASAQSMPSEPHVDSTDAASSELDTFLADSIAFLEEMDEARTSQPVPQSPPEPQEAVAPPAPEEAAAPAPAQEEAAAPPPQQEVAAPPSLAQLGGSMRQSLKGAKTPPAAEEVGVVFGKRVEPKKPGERRATATKAATGFQLTSPPTRAIGKTKSSGQEPRVLNVAPQQTQQPQKPQQKPQQKTQQTRQDTRKPEELCAQTPGEAAEEKPLDLQSSHEMTGDSLSRELSMFPQKDTVVSTQTIGTRVLTRAANQAENDRQLSLLDELQEEQASQYRQTEGSYIVSRESEQGVFSKTLRVFTDLVGMTQGASGKKNVVAGETLPIHMSDHQMRQVRCQLSMADPTVDQGLIKTHQQWVGGVCPHSNKNKS